MWYALCTQYSSLEKKKSGFLSCASFFDPGSLRIAGKTAIAQTVFAALASAVALPAALIAASSVIDNPWGVVMNSAKKAGMELAIALLSRTQGSRPVTLVGNSFGATVIFEALVHMATCKHHDGILQDVILFGAPVTGAAKGWNAVTHLIAGRLINFYSSKDTMLAVMMRGIDVSKWIAGVHGIDSSRAHNLDLTSMINAHSVSD